MTNKTFIYIIGALIFFSVQLNAQYRYVANSDTTYLFNDDSVTFSIPDGIRGNVSWQQKNQTGNWVALKTTEGEKVFKHKIVSTEDYRVLVSEGDCSYIFSDTIKIGYATDLADLLGQDFSFDYLLNVSEIPVQEFINDGVTIEYLLTQDLPLDSLLVNNLPLEDILAAGVTIADLMTEGITITELFEAKVGVGTFLDNGIDSTDLETAGLIGTGTTQEGDNFPWVKIGDQIWMAENLTVEHYNDMTQIYTTDIPSRDISAETGAEYLWAYNADDALAEIYGYLYTWNIAARQDKNICPSGWHVPTKIEIDTVVAYLGGTAIAGGALKEAGTDHWSSPNTGATNASGFSALPNGVRSQGGSFNNIFNWAYIWSSSEYETGKAYWLVTDFEHNKSYIGTPVKNHGAAIRCIKD